MEFSKTQRRASLIGLIPSLSQQVSYQAICEKLMGLFAQYNSRINSDLIGIKTELGSPFFASSLIILRGESFF
ncbi:hypothetical protein Lnau_2086 [Legionella nautarum]|uniref:Uncharacterized protein n=1 Tax=Legionella nautarum TaxID=45070 RepID=A0A0W0WN85_9GAMM|nr:hypothetical protein Lnau_2086 [Legionella nautarum]